MCYVCLWGSAMELYFCKIYSIYTHRQARHCEFFILNPLCKRDPKDFLQMRSEPLADTDRFNLFIDILAVLVKPGSQYYAGTASCEHPGR